VDGLREELGIGRRANDGFLQFTEEIRNAPPHILSEKTTSLWNRVDASGYTDGAIEALVRAGFTAWKNKVGDIAVLPPENSLPTV